MNSHESAREQASRQRSVKVRLILDSIAEYDKDDREYFRAFALSQVAFQVAVGKDVLARHEITGPIPEAPEPETIDYDTFKELVADFPHLYPNDSPQFKNLVTRAWNSLGSHLVFPEISRRRGTIADMSTHKLDLANIRKMNVDHRGIPKMGPSTEEMWHHALAKLGAKEQD